MRGNRNPWLGASLGGDPLAVARRLVKVHEQAMGRDAVRDEVRPLVSSSWTRSLDAGVDPEAGEAPMIHDRDDAVDRWSGHPLHRFMPLIKSLLLDFAHDAGHIVVVSDAEGVMLWSSGHPRVLAASERIAFVPGRLWNESAAGTNGIGTPLAIGHPVQIFSAEHFNRRIHSWVCSGAPVRDPETGRPLGVIDLSCGIREAHPHSLALVAAAATMVEDRLRSELAEKRQRQRARFFERVVHRGGGAAALVDHRGEVVACSPTQWLTGRVDVAGGGFVAEGAAVALDGEPLGDGASIVYPTGRRPAPRPVLRLEALGRRRAVVELGGTRLELSPRRSELLVLLALRPDGLTAEELAAELFGDEGKRVSVRAEMSRLRRLLGGVIAANPYRVTADLHADVLELTALVAAGRLAEARDRAPGDLLPGAASPAVRAARDALRAALARA